MCVLEYYFLYFSSKTYVVGTQKNSLNERPKHMFKFIGKEIIQFYAHKIYLSGSMTVSSFKDCFVDSRLKITAIKN